MKADVKYTDGTETTFTVDNAVSVNGDVAYIDGILHTDVDSVVVTGGDV